MSIGAVSNSGFLHDLGSAVYPLGAGSPFFSSLPLRNHGLEWIHSAAVLAHPFDDGTAVTLERDLHKAESYLGKDAKPWRRLLKPFAAHWNALSSEVLRPVHLLSRHPLLLARFALVAFPPATTVAHLFRYQRTKALFAGIAAHSFLPLESPVSSAFALVLGAAGHAVNWPLPRGGSQSISNALAECLRELGGVIEINRRVGKLDDLPTNRIALFDMTAWQFARIAGKQLPHNYRRRLEKSLDYLKTLGVEGR